MEAFQAVVSKRFRRACTRAGMRGGVPGSFEALQGGPPELWRKYIYSVSEGFSALRVLDATKYFVEVFGIDELEEYRRGVELVGGPDKKRQYDNFGSVS
eukprot:2474886-Pyramimonas_sp.AAC.1